MAKRFSRIRDGARLNVAFQRYREWEDERATRQPDVGGGTSRGPSVLVAITPFGRDLGTGVNAAVRVTQRARTIMGSAVGAHAPADPGQRISGFIPAKIILFAGTGTAVVATSDITGIRYLKRNGQSYTHAFGAATATEREMEAFAAIQSALVGEGGNRTVSYQPEIFRQI
ncbi:hypothetical protein IQ268_30540 [Oculatella sp. LEGE 06141]|uniref:hypothetical protein n=1 Tax=Oculatella sp. LEGE 06141 TaxID=1828648 RepID=UPI00187F9793|nr:hypothetical protein [Oculatella sp. LEGE 06141]MBE9182877.1 hypothetical protein [Oculatella sp. LEGE 06141]